MDIIEHGATGAAESCRRSETPSDLFEGLALATVVSCLLWLSLLWGLWLVG